MADVDRQLLSRRQWMGLASPSVLAASLAVEAAPAVALHEHGAHVYNVRDFGAVGDGTTLDTAALQAAIDACARDGGGTVLVPAGVFQIGTVELKSNVTLHLAAAARLLGSADGKQYHAVDAIPLSGDSTLGDGNWALLFAVNAANVTIEGRGTIDGQGLQFHPPVRGATPPSGLGGNRRPYHLLFYRCERLAVRDVALVESAYHSVRVIQCRHVQMRGLQIHNRVNGNNDGFHFISSENVAVSDCMVESQDDACALFGSCRLVTITNCTFSTRWSVFRFGGGTAENITVSNCVLHRVYGCPIKFHGGPGSRFENIAFSSLLLQDVTGPIHIAVGPWSRRTPPEAQAQGQAPPREPGREPAVARNISFSHIHGSVTTSPSQLPDLPFPITYNPGELHSCIALNGVGDAILENISFDDVHLSFGGGGTAEDAARRELPELAGEYFSLGPMPAYGLCARNARGVTLHNVRFQLREPDMRPALILDHVQDAAIAAFSVQGHTGAESVLRLIDSRDVLLTAPRVLNPSPAFLQLEGSGNQGIIVEGGDISKAAAPLALKNGAQETAVKLRS
jgi:hypothetical protein